MKVKVETVELALALVQRMVYLAWQACGGPLGMGFLQDNPNADEKSVWGQAYNEADYVGGRKAPDGHVRCDYVYGRMMKWGCKWSGNMVELFDQEYDPEYQGFSRKYANDKALLDAAAASLGIKIEVTA